MNPYNVNRKLAKKVQPHWYQTNASLSQPPTTAADRPVRDYVTNVRLSADRANPTPVTASPISYLGRFLRNRQQDRKVRR